MIIDLFVRPGLPYFYVLITPPFYGIVEGYALPIVLFTIHYGFRIYGSIECDNKILYILLFRSVYIVH